MSLIVEKIEIAVDVIERLQQAGHEAVFCGGCVRDFLLGKEPNDIDIATSATPEQVEALFEKTVAVGKSFGVIRVLVDEEEFEVATFRKDSSDSDGRRPNSVEFSSMEEDAKRRDLTINALFFDPIADKIYDFVGGQADIKARNIRFVGNPDERIEEDKLRLLRVIRFASRGGWVLNGATAEAIVRNAQNVSVVSKERVADELTKIFCNPLAHLGYCKLNDFHLFSKVLPPIWNYKVNNALRKASDDLVNNKILAWAIVLGHCEPQVAREILVGLKFDSDTTNSVVNIIERQMDLVGAKHLKGSERMKLIANRDFGNMMLWLAAYSYDIEHEYLSRVRESTPASQINPDTLVDGNDLIAMGMKPGKAFKDILAKVKDEQREGRITTREQASAFVSALIKG